MSCFMKLDGPWELIAMNSRILGNNCGKKLETQGWGPFYVSEPLPYEKKGYCIESLPNSSVGQELSFPKSRIKKKTLSSIQCKIVQCITTLQCQSENLYNYIFFKEIPRWEIIFVVVTRCSWCALSFYWLCGIALTYHNSGTSNNRAWISLERGIIYKNQVIYIDIINA